EVAEDEGCKPSPGRRGRAQRGAAVPAVQEAARVLPTAGLARLHGGSVGRAPPSYCPRFDTRAVRGGSDGEPGVSYARDVGSPTRKRANSPSSSTVRGWHRRHPLTLVAGRATGVQSSV